MELIQKMCNVRYGTHRVAVSQQPRRGQLGTFHAHAPGTCPCRHPTVTYPVWELVTQSTIILERLLIPQRPRGWFVCVFCTTVHISSPYFPQLGTALPSLQSVTTVEDLLHAIGGSPGCRVLVCARCRLDARNFDSSIIPACSTRSLCLQ